MEMAQHEDFFIQKLWHSLLEIELCAFEGQEALNTATKAFSDNALENLILDLHSHLYALDVSKAQVQRQIVTAARAFCEDSSCEEDMENIQRKEESKTEKKYSKEKLEKILKEARECTNALRVHIEKPVIQSKNGRWIKTHRGCELEDAKTLEASEYGRLKRDFDQQSSNIIILERERNAMSVQIEVLQAKVGRCKCQSRKVRFK